MVAARHYAPAASPRLQPLTPNPYESILPQRKPAEVQPDLTGKGQGGEVRSVEQSAMGVVVHQDDDELKAIYVVATAESVHRRELLGRFGIQVERELLAEHRADVVGEHRRRLHANCVIVALDLLVERGDVRVLGVLDLEKARRDLLVRPALLTGPDQPDEVEAGRANHVLPVDDEVLAVRPQLQVVGADQQLLVLHLQRGRLVEDDVLLDAGDERENGFR